MITEIKKYEWAKYFGELSRVMEGWLTKVEVFSPNIGAQTLSSGLPFGGVTFDEKDGKPVIDISLGDTAENHITHTIQEPVNVIFEDGSLEHGGILDIEDQEGAKTLIMFVKPYPATVQYESAAIVSISSQGGVT